MIIYLFLGLLLAVAVVGILVAFTRAEPAALARALRWAGFALAGAGLVLLPFIGRGSLIALGPAIILPLLTRLLIRRSSPGGGWSGGGWPGGAGTGTRGPRPGQSSTVRTARLVMTLDHDSGAMDGEVLGGRFAGRRLSTLGRAELIELLDECRVDDADSAALLEAYLDRVHGADWRSRTGYEGARGGGEGTEDGSDGRGRARRGGAAGGMSREEAYEILGLAPGASPAAVKEAHRRLMQKLHPDHGGSTYLAAKINQAKDLLLGN